MGNEPLAEQSQGARHGLPPPPPAQPPHRSAPQGQDVAESKAMGYPTHRPSGKTVLRQTFVEGRWEMACSQKPGPHELLQEDT